MASDIFAKIGTIKGESLDSKHKDEVEVQSFSWGVSNSGSMAHGGGGGTGKANFNDLQFTHIVDKASPVLMAACADGTHYPDATITFRKSGKGQQEFMIYKLSDVIVTSVTPSGHSNSSATEMFENVSIQFGKVIVEYHAQKADGSLDAAVFFKYDIKGNKTL